MRMDRRVVAGGAALVAVVVAVHSLTQLMPAGSSPVVAVVDAGIPLLEIGALALTSVALWRNRSSPARWTWVFLGMWLAANLFADLAWGWYELGLGLQPASPSVADIGYLVSYPLAFLTVVFAAWKAAGRLRAAEAALDAAMVTLGAAGLAWPLLLSPLVNGGEGGASYFVNLAYPLGDLLVIVAFASLLLGSWRERPPRFLVVIWVAFLIQVVADSLYFVTAATAGGYQSGGLPDTLWALVFALAGIAALTGMFPAAEKSEQADRNSYETRTRVYRAAWGYARMLLPYFALPVVGVMIWLDLASNGLDWTGETSRLVYVGVALVALLVIRQYLTLFHNRRLNTELTALSDQLSERVHVLGDLSERLEELNTRANELNSLRTVEEVVKSGLELARSVARCSAAWVVLTEEDGSGSGSGRVAATLGPTEHVPEVGSQVTSFAELGPQLQEVRLRARAEEIGSLWLAHPSDDHQGPDLLQAVGAHLATAIDNTRRYEKLLQLAERDALTGLYNHGGIHSRLSGEVRRAQQLRRPLAVAMMDLDDFKLLNDTYGHPTGDRVLAQVSDTTRAILRESDFAGRVGGDEIMLVLPDTDREGAIRLAERLREQLASQLFDAGGGCAIPIGVSCGVAAYPQDGVSSAALVAAADASLYASKERGGGIVTGADTESEAKAEPVGLRGVATRLLDLLGAKDHYTRRHADQVVAHALRLGGLLGLPDESLDTLRLAAMLHDVGKIDVHPHVLRKPGPLNQDEESAVRRHVAAGEAIIRDLPRVTEVLEVVRFHHERHDGSGYPAGLAGDDIPLLARILAVADAYSAMVVDRPYRGKLSAEQAKSELLRVAGAQLDPELVDRFVRDLSDEKRRIYAVAG